MGALLMLGFALWLWPQPGSTTGSVLPAFAPSLDFSDLRNSGYAAITGF